MATLAALELYLILVAGFLMMSAYNTTRDQIFCRPDGLVLVIPVPVVSGRK